VRSIAARLARLEAARKAGQQRIVHAPWHAGQAMPADRCPLQLPGSRQHHPPRQSHRRSCSHGSRHATGCRPGRGSRLARYGAVGGCLRPGIISRRAAQIVQGRPGRIHCLISIRLRSSLALTLPAGLRGGLRGRSLLLTSLATGRELGQDGSRGGRSGSPARASGGSPPRSPRRRCASSRPDAPGPSPPRWR
jgi:hypothetical protein